MRYTSPTALPTVSIALLCVACESVMSFHSIY